MIAMLRQQRWRHTLVVVLITQLLFWSCYALLLREARSANHLGERLPAQSTLDSAPEPLGIFASALAGPALLRIPGWQDVVLYPAQAGLLMRDEADERSAEAWSLVCITVPCGARDDVRVGPLDQMIAVARLERFGSYDMVWLSVQMGLTLGAALLILLPLSRFSRLQTIVALFLILMGADAWLRTFGAMALPHAWFPLLFYGVEYATLVFAALSVNSFAGWRTREAWIAGTCGAALLAVVGITLLAGRDVASVAWWLDAAALVLLMVYGDITLRRLALQAPGPALRVTALLFIGLTAMAWDLLRYVEPGNPGFQATFLERPILMLGALLEIAMQGHRLNQEADFELRDIEHQALEQDAHLLRSSSLLRYQERKIAVGIERQRFLRDMHDGVGGTLTHLLLELRERSLSRSEIEQGLQSALDDLRNIACSIDAGDGPIDEALTIFHERMAARLSRSGVTFDWRCNLPIPAPSLNAQRLLNLHRLLQEGIANVLRHADSSRIELVAETVGSKRLTVTLWDDGVGFDPTNTRGACGEGRGLANMQRRAEQMNGTLHIDSAPGCGTRLILDVPL
jgi:signal transduction histidine kinase